MCGIAGIISTDRSPLGEQDLRALTLASTSLRHRGPDDDGLVCSDSRSAAFAHRRLSIIDPTPEGHQPMIGSGGTMLVFNGEIYNYRALRSQYDLRVPLSDTAVLLALLESRGVSILPELRGFFSFAWWSESNRMLTIARDSIGKKPVYYTERSGRFLFASELRALIASGTVPISIAPESLAQYLRFYCVPHPDTIVDGVKILPPASVLQLSEHGAITVERWYRLPKQQDIAIDYEEARRETRRLLERSVRDRLVSDVPVGAFLSGGLDSNAIVGLASRQSTTPIETFTIGFQQSKLDESNWAKLGARAFGTAHHACNVSEHDISEWLPEFFRAIDSPTGDGLNTFLISKSAHRIDPNLKVILSGVGGDEAFLGYAKYRWLAKRASLFRTIWSLPKSLRSSCSEFLMGFPHARIQSAMRASVFPEGSRFLFSRNDIRRLTGNRMAETESQTMEPDPLLALLRSDEEDYLPNMLLRDLDTMTMSQSLEARAPLLDRELLEFTWQLPMAIKVRGTSKQLLADSVSDIVPIELRAKPKTGFELPMHQWLQSTLRPHLDILLDDSLRLYNLGLFQKTAVRKVHADFLRGTSHYLKPWCLIVLEEWLRAIETSASQTHFTDIAA